MESTNSVRVNGLLYISKLAEVKFIYFLFEGEFNFIELRVELAGGVFGERFC